MYIKILNLILAILSLVFMIILPISADEHIKNEGSDASGNNITYTLNTDGVLTISGKGEMADYYLTDSPWNSQKSKVKSVVIEGEFTNIGSGAFSHAENLTNVRILCDIKSIDDYAFNNCFNLSSIELPESVECIGNTAFLLCHALKIPKSVKSIGTYPFGGCESLVSLEVSPENDFYTADENGVLFNKDKTELIYAPRHLKIRTPFRAV